MYGRDSILLILYLLSSAPAQYHILLQHSEGSRHKLSSPLTIFWLANRREQRALACPVFSQKLPAHEEGYVHQLRDSRRFAQSEPT